MKKILMAAIAAATLCGCAQTEPEQTQAPDVYSADVTAGGEYYATIEYNDEHGQWSGKVLPVEVIAPECLESGSGLYMPTENRVIPWGSVDEAHVNLISVGAWK